MLRRLATGMIWAIVACAPRTGELVPPAAAPVQTPLVLVYQAARTDGVHEVGFEPMLDDLATRQIVLVGETHLDDNTHRLEHALLEGLSRRKPGKVVLALEMFQRDVQPILDAYMRGEIDEATFLAQSRPWPNYDTDYRPLVEFARAAGIAVVAANLPVELQRAFAMKGAEAEGALTPEQRAVFPREVFPPHEAYWERLGHRLRDHFHGHDAAASPEARAYSVQNLWDNAMAEAAVDALDADPERVVLLVAGAFHVEYGQGLAHQIHARRPQLDVGLVTILPTHDLQTISAERDQSRADYLLYTPARARGVQGGVLATTLPGELEFRLHLPEAARSDTMPLLVWLGEAGDGGTDEQRYWEVALGTEAIVVTVEPPHPEQTADLRMAGRWWWSHRLERDLSHLGIGLNRLLEYVTDRFEVDPYHIVVAGRGSGATAVLWAGVAGELPGARLVAWGPQDTDALTTRALPEQEPPVRRAALIGADPSLADALGKVGIATQIEAMPEELARQVLEDRLRAALGIAKRQWSDPERTLLLTVESDVGLRWAELHARIAEQDAGTVRVRTAERETDPGQAILDVSPGDFADGLALPLAPGPFGGTTILVLPSGLAEQARAEWKALEEGNVIQARSRFAAVRVVEDVELPSLLEQLKSSGKRSMLIVPAAFVVDAERMQALQRAAAPAAAGLDIRWLPGLGGELARARIERLSSD